MYAEKGRLKYVGRHRLGFEDYDYFQCQTCKTDYPSIGGRITCNGKGISVCPYCFQEKFYEISENDVGNNTITAFGKTWDPAFFMQVLPVDVGKRVFLRNGILLVENNEQRDARVAKEVSHGQKT